MKAALPWSDDELSTLKRLHRQGMTCFEIAKALPIRNIDTVRAMLNRHGLASNRPQPDTSAIDADRALIARAFKAGMGDVRIKSELMPHRSRTWIEQQRRSMGLKRVAATGGNMMSAEESDVQVRQRLRRSSVMLLAALKASHARPGPDVREKQGMPRHMPRFGAEFSPITSFGNLCAELGYAD